MARSVTVKLREPIKFGEQVIEALTLQPLKAKHLRKLQSDKSMQMIIELAGYLSGQTTQVIDELQGEDLAEVIKVVGDFFAAFQPTGGAP